MALRSVASRCLESNRSQHGSASVQANRWFMLPKQNIHTHDQQCIALSNIYIVLFRAYSVMIAAKNAL